MTFVANAVESLTVKKRDGSVIATLTGKVKLKAGDSIKLETTGDEITVSAGQEFIDEGDRFRRKYNTIINGGTFIDDDGTPYVFSGAPYYIAKIAGVGGNFVYNYDFLSNACGQVGIFEEIVYVPPGTGSGSGSSSEGGLPDPIGPFASMLNVSGELELLDMCQACVDCEDYADIVTLMDRIETFQDWDVTRNLDDVGEGGELALYRQFQATIGYWNYLVHQQAIPLAAVRGSDDYFAINTGYYNKGSVALNNVTETITVTFNWAGQPGGVQAAFSNILHRPDDAADPGLGITKVNDTTWDFKITFPPLDHNDYMFLQLVIKTDEPLAQVSLDAEWCNTHLTNGVGCLNKVRDDVL